MMQPWRVSIGFAEVTVEAEGWPEALAEGLPQLGIDLRELGSLAIESEEDGGAIARDRLTDLEIRLEPLGAPPAFLASPSFDALDAPDWPSAPPPAPATGRPGPLAPTVTSGAEDAPEPRRAPPPPRPLPPVDAAAAEPPSWPSASPTMIPPPFEAPPPPRVEPAPVPAAAAPPPPVAPPPRVEPAPPPVAAAPPPVAPPPRVEPAPPPVAAAPSPVAPPPVSAPPDEDASRGGIVLEPDGPLSDDVLMDLFLSLGEIASATGVASAAGIALRILLSHVPAGAGAVLIRTRAGDGLRFRAASGPAAGRLVDTVIPLDRGIAGFVSQLGVALSVEDARRDRRHDDRVDRATGYTTRAMVAVPVRSDRGVPFGCIELLNPPRPFTAEDLSVAARVAGSLGAFLESVYAEH